jgi:acetyl esterase/lipase
MSRRSHRRSAQRTLLAAMVGILLTTVSAGVVESQLSGGTSADRGARAARVPDRRAGSNVALRPGAPDVESTPCWDAPTDDTFSPTASTVGAALPSDATRLATSPCMVQPAGPADRLPLGYEIGVAATFPNIHYGDDAQQQLDLYVPNTTAAPVIVFFHAGGWVAGDRTTVAQAILQEVTRGYAVASVEYRLAPQVRFPVPLQDAKTAIRWVKAHAAQFGLRADKVFAAGSSAGGHLAAMVAVTPGLFEPGDVPPDLAAQDSRVVAAVSFVGPLDLNSLGGEVGTWGPGLVSTLLGCAAPAPDEPATCSQDAMAAASPVSYVTRDDPPIYLSYGVEDTLVPPSTNGLVMATEYAQLGRRLEARYDLVQDQGHNVDIEGANITMLDRFLDWNVDGLVE